MTRNTEHGTEHTGGSAEHPRLRPASFARSVEPTVPHGARSTEHADGARSTEHEATTDAVTVTTPTEHGARSTEQRGAFRRFSEWRSTRAEQAERSAEHSRAERALRSAQKAEQRAAEQRIEEATRSAATRLAAQSRSAGRGARNTAPEAKDIAPVPVQMRWLAIWLDRTFGALPLIAPLVVSGFLTANVFMDEPINLPWYVAVLVTVALEGGLYKLVILKTNTQLEGDSTLSLMALICLYLGIISGLIYWHALYTEATKQGAGLIDAEIGWGWLPAAGSAGFSILGVLLSSKDARFKHRAKLRADDRIDRQAPRFSVLSWIFCPWETFWSFRHAVKFRVERPLAAVIDWRRWKLAGKPRVWPELIDQETDGTLDGADLVHGTLERNTLTELEQDLLEHGARNALPVYGAAERSVPTAPLLRSLPTAERSTAPAPTTERLDTAPPPARNAEHGAGGADGTRSTGITADQYASDNGAPFRETAAPQSAPPAGGARSGSDDIPLNLAEHILAVTEAYPGWQTELPKSRGAMAAIDADFRRRGRRGPQGQEGFGSSSTTAKVMGILRSLADDPDIAESLNRMRTNRTN